MDDHYEFYREVLESLLSSGTLRREMRILVACAEKPDQEVLQSCGFSNVVISNLDSVGDATEYAPFDWSFQDAENLTYEAGAFDFCVVHSGLHHCASPHRALLEMYRVAREGVLLFEPSDNALTRLAVRLGIGQEYESADVFYNDYAHAGLRNSPIPNYVYRWTEREVIKTVQCFAPYGRHRFRFMYRTRVPYDQLKGRKNRLIYFIALLAMPLVRLATLVLPKQSNNFAALVLKPDLSKDLYPWLRHTDDGIDLDRDWLAQRYKEQ